MSAQPASIIIGPRIGQGSEVPGVGDLQRIVDRALSILSRRRWLFVFLLLTGLLGTLIVAILSPRLYTMAAMLERRDDPVLTELIQANSPFSFIPQRRSLVLDLMNREAATAVLEEAGLLGDASRDSDGALTQAAKERLRKHLADVMPGIRVNLMEKGPELDIINIRYTGPYPELGMLMINGLKDRYAEGIQRRINDIYHQSHGFFQSQAQTSGKEAAVLHVELSQMLAKYPGSSPTNPYELDNLLVRAKQQAEDLTIRQGELNDRIAYHEEHLRLLERQEQRGQFVEEDAEAETVWIPNPQRAELATSIAQLEGEITDAMEMKQMTDHHPQIEKWRSRLERLRIEYQSEPERVEHIRSLDPRWLAAVAPEVSEAERKRAEMDLSSLRKKLQQNERELSQAQAQLITYNQQLKDLPQRRDAYIDLKRKYDRAQSDFNVWNRHVGELERVIKADSEECGIHFRTMQQALMPGRPFSPTVFGVFLLAVGVGLGLAIAAVFLREMFDRSVRDPNRIRRLLGIPVLETIGEIQGAPTAGERACRVLVRSCASVQMLLVVVAGALFYLSVAQPAVYKNVTAAVLSLLS